jgi:hypothetical protein
MSYLERWWRDAKQTQKEDFIRLVKNGQLEIVGGGWVMNDEVLFSLCLCIFSLSPTQEAFVNSKLYAIVHLV